MESTQQAAPLIAQINQVEAKLETTSDNGIKGTVQQDFLDDSSVIAQINHAEGEMETSFRKWWTNSAAYAADSKPPALATTH
jgi:hypothetical protein